MSWLCCLGIVWEPIRETSSHVSRQGTIVHIRLSWLSLCGLILDLNEWTSGAWADLCLGREKKKKKPQAGHGSPSLPPKSSQTRKSHSTVATPVSSRLFIGPSDLHGRPARKKSVFTLRRTLWLRGQKSQFMTAMTGFLSKLVYLLFYFAEAVLQLNTFINFFSPSWKLNLPIIWNQI